MDKLKNIDTKLLESEKKYSKSYVSTLSNNEKEKIRIFTSDETTYLILVLYIILILFVSITLFIIIQGDKENTYKIYRKFKGDYNNENNLTIWDKIYYLIFGTHRTNKYDTQCDYLTCKKVPYQNNKNNNNYIYDNNGKRKILSNNDKKYQYLESFNNNDTNMYRNCNENNNNNYIAQFNSSRKCLTGYSDTNIKNSNNNSKYNYLSTYNYNNDELD